MDAAPATSSSRPRRTETPRPSSFATSLATEVGEIAQSSSIPRIKKERLISTAVRKAVVDATRLNKDQNEILKIAMELTTAAARTAPPFADVIARAASFSGPVAQVDGAAARIRAATFAAAKNPQAAGTSHRFPESNSDSRSESGRETTYGSTPRVVRPSASELSIDEPGPASAASQTAESSEPRLQFGDNASLSFTAAIGVSHDSNIFLKSENEEEETITSITPGADFRFGHNSLAHGGLSYKLALSRYANNSALNSKLSTGGADFGYDNGTTSIAAAANYQQVDQVNRDIASVAGNTLVRRNVLNLDTSAETSLTAKTSVQSGVAINWTEYKRVELTGSKNITVPLKVYVEVTPKLALSGGASYTRVQPQGDGAKGTDLFYNLGLRGPLTSKLSANFSAGYRTRKVGDGSSNGMWGFDGSFSYEATPKTSLAVVLSRDFSVSAIGESLENGSYFLNFTSNPTLHWQFAGALGYRTIDYGANLFADPSTPVVQGGRADTYWETSLSATYIFNSWLSANASWTHRVNRSNAPGAKFSDDVLSLMVVLQY